MLSGWARLRFPSLVHGAVASSAPVRAEVDMRGYYDVVAYAYAAASVGGSKACRDNIAAGHASILKQLASDAGRRELAKAFDLDAEWLAKRDNQVRFAGYGVANFPAQSNDDHCESVYCNVRKICALMDGSEDPVADLARLSSAQAAADGLRAWESRAAKRAARFAERDALGGVSADDLWVWQTCTEFAFYQTCEVGSDCMFAQGLVTLDVEEADCADWAIGRDTVAANVAATNAHTGGAAPSGVPRVLWPHGEVDPWRANGVDGDALAQGQETWTVEGASHHEWTHPSKVRAPTLVRGVAPARVRSLAVVSACAQPPLTRASRRARASTADRRAHAGGGALPHPRHGQAVAWRRRKRGRHRSHPDGRRSAGVRACCRERPCPCARVPRLAINTALPPARPWPRRSHELVHSLPPRRELSLARDPPPPPPAATAGRSAQARPPLVFRRSTMLPMQRRVHIDDALPRLISK